MGNTISIPRGINGIMGVGSKEQLIAQYRRFWVLVWGMSCYFFNIRRAQCHQYSCIWTERIKFRRVLNKTFKNITRQDYSFPPCRSYLLQVAYNYKHFLRKTEIHEIYSVLWVADASSKQKHQMPFVARNSSSMDFGLFSISNQEFVCLRDRGNTKGYGKWFN